MSEQPGPGDGEPESAEQPMQPTPEQYAERARKANKATRGALAGLLGLEALIVLLIPRAIVFTGLGPVRTAICIALAVLLIVAAGLLRRSWGIGLGSVLQVAFLATGFLQSSLFLVGALFIAIWLRLLLLRHEVVGTPGGLRMLAG